MTTQYEQELFEQALGPDPRLTREQHRVDALMQYAMPHILKVMDRGDHLATLPLAGSKEWERATDGEKWAAIAIAAAQGLWAIERGPEERLSYSEVAYSEAQDRIELELSWATYAYSEGYERGKREQAAIERRIRAGIERRQRGDA